MHFSWAVLRTLENKAGKTLANLPLPSFWCCMVKSIWEVWNGRNRIKKSIKKNVQGKINDENQFFNNSYSSLFSYFNIYTYFFLYAYSLWFCFLMVLFLKFLISAVLLWTLVKGKENTQPEENTNKKELALFSKLKSTSLYNLRYYEALRYKIQFTESNLAFRNTAETRRKKDNKQLPFQLELFSNARRVASSSALIILGVAWLPVFMSFTFVFLVYYVRFLHILSHVYMHELSDKRGHECFDEWGHERSAERGHERSAERRHECYDEWGHERSNERWHERSNELSHERGYAWDHDSHSRSWLSFLTLVCNLHSM